MKILSKKVQAIIDQRKADMQDAGSNNNVSIVEAISTIMARYDAMVDVIEEQQKLIETMDRQLQIHEKILDADIQEAQSYFDKKDAERDIEQDARERARSEEIEAQGHGKHVSAEIARRAHVTVLSKE
jgi:hypothetical protein